MMNQGSPNRIISFISFPNSIWERALKRISPNARKHSFQDNVVTKCNLVTRTKRQLNHEGIHHRAHREHREVGTYIPPRDSLCAPCVLCGELLGRTKEENIQ